MVDTPTSKMEWALWLAEKGFEILPLNAGSKNPKRGFGWLGTLTSEPEKIREWFDEDPDMNYGVCPGQHNVILDLDDKPWENKDGVSHLIGLELEHEPIGDTLTARSPSGGKHLFLSLPPDHPPVGNVHEFGKDSGIDVRGYHGYVVGPGSELVEGKCKPTDIPGPYVIENPDCEITQVPDWLLSGYLRKKRERDDQADTPLIPLDLPENLAKAEDFLKSRAPAVTGRGGNQHTYDTATFLRDFGLSEDKAIEVMLSSDWNDRCQPPWDWDELSDVVAHAYRYGQNRPGSKADVLGMYERMMGDVMEAEEDEIRVGPDDLDEHLFGPDSFTKRGKRREYIIPNWLPAHGFTALLAKRGVGKSTILLDLACRMACDMDWQGLQIKEDFVAIYLCGEDDEGLELNMVAWQEVNQEIPADRMIIADVVTNLMSAENVEKWARKLHEKLAGRKAVVFLDTWQRATSAAGQNKDEDMQLCVHHAEALARSLGGPLIGAFHPPKYNENTIHGSAIIENSTVAIWVLDDSNHGGKKLRVERIKGPGYGSYRLFDFKEVPLDEEDAFGNKQKGLVPVKTGGTEDSGTTEQQEEYDAKRLAWAWLIYGILDRNAGADAKDRITPTRNAVVTALVEKTQDPDFMEEFGQHAMEQKLKFGKNTIERALTRLFFDEGSRPFSFDSINRRLSVNRSVKPGTSGGIFEITEIKEDEL